MNRIQNVNADGPCLRLKVLSHYALLRATRTIHCTHSVTYLATSIVGIVSKETGAASVGN